VAPQKHFDTSGKSGASVHRRRNSRHAPVGPPGLDQHLRAAKFNPHVIFPQALPIWCGLRGPASV